jgi:hypothetical protein
MLAMTTASGGCDLAAPPDRAFGIPLEAERVRLVLELWIEGAKPGWAESLLDVADRHEVAVMVVVPPTEPGPEVAKLLQRVDDGPHEAAVVLDARSVPRDVLQGLGDLKRLVKPVRRAAGTLRVVMAPIGSRASEAMLGRAGFRALVNTEGPPTAQARMAGHLEGQPRINVVLHAGPYTGDCGPEPVIGPFTPAAADRAASAIQRANASAGAPIVRVGLLGSAGSDDDASVFDRWLSEVVEDSGVSVVTANDARLAALQSFRRGEEAAPEGASKGGRVVSVEDARLAAADLSEVVVLPRALPGELTPTEAFYALCMLAVDAVRTTARALLGAMPTEVPSALPVGGRLLTASELLLAFASVVRGDDPVVTRPVSVPEPNERGLGWGIATLP